MGLDGGGDARGDLFEREGAFVRNDDVKDEVGVGRALVHAEIVQGKGGVDRPNDRKAGFLQLQNAGALRKDGVHMNGGDAGKFLGKTLFDVVNEIVQL